MKLRDLKNKLLFYFWNFKNDSYSQEGENLILKRFFDSSIDKKGFYVDIGAHHPKRFSNTYRFYKKGWRGINVDATPGSMKLFKIWRRRDINLEMGVAKESGEFTFYMFNDPALNGFHQSVADYHKSSRYYVIAEKKIKTEPLSLILDKFLPANTAISFMSIDVEGKDLEVIQSNNWEKYRPQMLLIESLENSLDTIHDLESHHFLKQVGYSLFAKTVNTLIYKNTR